MFVWVMYNVYGTRSAQYKEHREQIIIYHVSVNKSHEHGKSDYLTKIKGNCVNAGVHENTHTEHMTCPPEQYYIK